MAISPNNSTSSVCIIGAGVVGCAIAYELSRHGYSVMVIDIHSKSGQGITSRNSEVIHAGMYYPTNSLKAKLCVEGRELLYSYCKQFAIPHKKIGKIIVATSSHEQDELEKINSQALANGLLSLQPLTKTEVLRLEPFVAAEMGLFSPETGIISTHDFCHSLEGQATNSGATFAYQTAVTNLVRGNNGGWKITTHSVLSSSCPSKHLGLSHPTLAPSLALGTEAYEFEVDLIINSAGLHSDWICALSGINPFEHQYKLTWVKGEYFSLSSSWGKKISHLIYPVPEKNTRGLGVHVTIDMGGQAKLGPNVVEIEEVIDPTIILGTNDDGTPLYAKVRKEDYTVDSAHRVAFYDAARRYLPSLSIDDLTPAYSGIRPKLSKSGEKARDFAISEESSKGAPGLINLIGIESPGLTSSLAIARMVRSLI